MLAVEMAFAHDRQGRQFGRLGLMLERLEESQGDAVFTMTIAETK